jgi:5-carboxymethyl-2-hydroxymuconate isomerase
VPHIIIEYSANLEDSLDMAAFCDHLRKTAAGIDAFPTPGIRVRAFKADHYAIADGNPDHAFLDISLRLRGGRSDEVKKASTEEMFAAITSYLAPTLERRSLAVSFEMRDIDPELSPKTGTIRKYLKDS